jgi:hypothetical protein
MWSDRWAPGRGKYTEQMNIPIGERLWVRPEHVLPLTWKVTGYRFRIRENRRLSVRVIGFPSGDGHGSEGSVRNIPGETRDWSHDFARKDSYSTLVVRLDLSVFSFPDTTVEFAIWHGTRA